MAKYVKTTFEYHTLEVDNNVFENCVFRNSKLIFKGRQPFSLINCNFDNVQWELDGHAALTMKFLESMYHGTGEMGKVLVEKLFDQVRKGDIPNYVVGGKSIESNVT